MKIIKLNTIDSTNSFLKELAQNSRLQNYTIVTTEKQVFGRGQQENKWHSEPFKNLTISIFISFKELALIGQRYLNFAVSLAIYDALLNYKIPNLSIKWPNDILCSNKKVCGILIENITKAHKIQSSIIGMGINVNQENFPEFIQNATSMKNCIKEEIDLDVLLESIVFKLKEKMNLLNTKQFDLLEEQYLCKLYKKNTPSMFRDSNNDLFMGIIKSVSSEGKLQIELENNSLKDFGIKEISFV